MGPAILVLLHILPHQGGCAPSVASSHTTTIRFDFAQFFRQYFGTHVITYIYLYSSLFIYHTSRGLWHVFKEQLYLEIIESHQINTKK